MTKKSGTDKLEARILEMIASPNYQPVKPKVIAKKLGASKEEAEAIRKTVKRLVKQGKLAWGPKHIVKALKSDNASGKSGGKSSGKNQAVGVFRPTSQGYGFVTPRATDAVATPDASVADSDPDIFIPPGKSLGAIDGDIVKVTLKKSRDGGPAGRGPEGTIVEVLERFTNRFVGVYAEEAGFPEVTVAGTTFSHPIPVGDPGAKRVVEGDKVVIEMVRFPFRHDEGEAVIVEVLGARGAPGVDTLSIIREFGLARKILRRGARECSAAGGAI